MTTMAMAIYTGFAAETLAAFQSALAAQDQSLAKHERQVEHALEVHDQAMQDEADKLVEAMAASIASHKRDVGVVKEIDSKVFRAERDSRSIMCALSIHTHIHICWFACLLGALAWLTEERATLASPLPMCRQPESARLDSIGIPRDRPQCRGRNRSSSGASGRLGSAKVVP